MISWIIERKKQPYKVSQGRTFLKKIFHKFDTKMAYWTPEDLLVTKNVCLATKYESFVLNAKKNA